MPSPYQMYCASSGPYKHNQLMLLVGPLTSPLGAAPPPRGSRPPRPPRNSKRPLEAAADAVAALPRGADVGVRSPTPTFARFTRRCSL
eukprot:8627654-Pyramimonas_sp.AAC.2